MTTTAEATSQSPLDKEKSILLARMQSRYKEPLKALSTRQNAVAAACASVLDKIGSLVDRNKPDTQSRDPRVLLDQRVPLTKLVQEHGLDITELINDHGLNINDFFSRGYSMSHMCDAFASRLNRDEGRAVLYALGMSVDHFTMVPQYVQQDLMRERLGYEPSWLLDFGYHFDPNKHTLTQLVGLGLTMPMVMDAGLRTRSQWEYLKANGSGSELVKFGCTAALENELLLDIPIQQQRVNYSIPSTIGVPAYATQGPPPPASSSNIVVARAVDPRAFEPEPEPEVGRSNVPRLRTPAEIQRQSAARLVVLRKY